MSLSSKKRVTLKTLASQLGLSSQAVSQALRDDPGTVRVSAANRMKVRQLAAKLGYRQNRAALTLRNGRSGLLGVLHFGTGNMLGQQQLHHLVEEMKLHGVSPIIHYANIASSDSRNQAVEVMQDLRVNGVLLSWPSGGFKQSEVDRLKQFGIPVTVLGGHWLKGVSRFYTDKRAGFRDLTLHLIEEGRHNITLLCGKSGGNNAPYSWHRDQALAGFNDAILASGCPKTRFHIHGISPGKAVESVSEQGLVYTLCIPGYVGMKEIIASGQIPDAVICQVDDWAMGALRACQEEGIRVPEDIAMAGFENNPTSSAGPMPLTTVAQPLDQLSKLAVDELLAMTNGRLLQQDKDVALPGKLIIRQSSVRTPIDSPW